MSSSIKIWVWLQIGHIHVMTLHVYPLGKVLTSYFRQVPLWDLKSLEVLRSNFEGLVIINIRDWGGGNYKNNLEQ